MRLAVRPRKGEGSPAEKLPGIPSRAGPPKGASLRFPRRVRGVGGRTVLLSTQCRAIAGQDLHLAALAFDDEQRDALSEAVAPALRLRRHARRHPIVPVDGAFR